MRPPFLSLSPADYRRCVIIAVVIGASAVAFAYTAGWLTSESLTPKRLVAVLAPANGPALGHRRNHAKGICFSGVFEANGDGVSISRAKVFERGQYPVLGRFNTGSPNPYAADATVRVRGMGLQIKMTDGEEWRMAMINPPIFPVSTPQAFYDLQVSSSNKDPAAMKHVIAANPEFLNFLEWAKNAPWTGSYAQEPYNSLNSFIFSNASGHDDAVRWSLRPETQSKPVAQADLAKLGADFLEQEITERIGRGPIQWDMMVTIADPADLTSDPARAWPADRRSLNVGVLSVRQVQAERDGLCRDINFDPTVLPRGIKTSDDPFPAARSSAYRESYDLRTAEAKYYPRGTPEVQP